jgi:hypothetical protein
MIRWLLFETKLGEALLVLIERHMGLALVQASWLAEQRTAEPTTAPELK